MNFKRIRAGRGLGDALYLQSIVRHLAARGEQLEVCTDYPELFAFPGVRFAPFSRANIRYTCHYTQAKGDDRTDQFTDMCRLAGVGPVELKLDWRIRNAELIARIRHLAAGRPLLLVHGGREAFGRSDGYGLELLPDRRVFNRIVQRLRAQGYYALHVGKGRRLYPLSVDVDFHDSTGVTDVIDIGAIADVCVAQCSFVIPLAESFATPLLIVFAARGFASAKMPIRTITPKKVLSQPTSRYVVDNWSVQRIEGVVDEFSNARASGGAIPRAACGGGGQCADVSAQPAGFN